MATEKKEDDFEFEVEGEEVKVEVVDDTPEEDRGREPMPKEIVEELENDDLGEYSEKVKIRLKQYKKVWHDERRAKEVETREKQEAVDLAKKFYEENKRLNATLHRGEETLVSTYKEAAELEAAAARKDYKEAYEAGDSDKVLAAQEKLNAASYKIEQLKGYKPALQQPNTELEVKSDTAPVVRLDQKTTAWQERNKWYGSDPEMTAAAFGLHQKLTGQHGAAFAGTEDYWQAIDKTMQRRFPEYFGDIEKPDSGKPARSESKAPTVVAPASRSTSSKRIVLKQSQLSIAKRLGVTPEQYAREMAKLENN